MARGKRPAPFRTRKLSPSAPMVLHLLRCGRVGRRRTFFQKTRFIEAGLLLLYQGFLSLGTNIICVYITDLSHISLLFAPEMSDT